MLGGARKRGALRRVWVFAVSIFGPFQERGPLRDLQDKGPIIPADSRGLMLRRAGTGRT